MIKDLPMGDGYTVKFTLKDNVSVEQFTNYFLKF